MRHTSNKWATFCKTQTVNISNGSIKDDTEFLLSLHKKGLGCSAINTARSVLLNILPVKEGIEFGKHPILTRMLKAIFRIRPALPRYICIYDAEIVIDFLKSLPCWEKVTPKWLTLKLVTLLALFYLATDIKH